MYIQIQYIGWLIVATSYIVVWQNNLPRSLSTLGPYKNFLLSIIATSTSTSTSTTLFTHPYVEIFYTPSYTILPQKV